jgi:hypothetical protein
MMSFWDVNGADIIVAAIAATGPCVAVWLGRRQSQGEHRETMTIIRSVDEKVNGDRSTMMSEIRELRAQLADQKGVMEREILKLERDELRAQLAAKE